MGGIHPPLKFRICSELLNVGGGGGKRWQSGCQPCSATKESPLMWPHEDQDAVTSGENEGWTKNDAQRSSVAMKCGFFTSSVIDTQFCLIRYV